MGAKRDLASEIEEIRNRTGPSDLDNGITKLQFIVDRTRRFEKNCEEYAYFLVASISAIETYFRWEIQRLVDSGDARYINNLRLDDLSLKINHDLLMAVHGKRVSIGELVAHAVQVHSIDAINKIMGQLLQTDFIELVKNARYLEMRREQGESAPTIVQSISETLAGVKRTFELRHIICHEAHYYMAIQTDEVKNLCSCCYNFALASYHGIGFHQNPNAPLTLAEAYEAVSARVLVLENEINTVEAHIISKMDIQMQKRFDAIRQAWKTYLDREAEFNSSLHMNGNRGELYAQLTIESLYNKRLLELKKYARQIDIFP